jgi:hypothetical protein
MFKAAWDVSFTKENIQSAFKKPGIWPIDGTKIIKKVSKPNPIFNPTLNTPLKTPKTPLDSRALCQAYHTINCSPTTQKLDRIFKSTRVLSAQVSILKKENKGLVEALALKKNKHKKGRRLNLYSKESSNVKIYIPGKVVAAREYIEAKDI